MYSAATVANVFLDLANEDAKPLTHMKIQKLVYISHGWNLALSGDALSYDSIRAWQYGPVIPNLYAELKRFGGRPVTEKVPLLPTQAEIDPAGPEMRIVRMVWRSYGKLAAPTLSAITHKPDTPWSVTWSENPYGTINDEVIKQHYLKLKDERFRPKRQPA